MFRSHVKTQLSAYCNGELPAEESRHISEHLLACQGCRKEYEKIDLGVRLAAELEKVTAPAQIWTSIEDSLTGGADLHRLPSVRRSAWTAGWRVPALAAALVLMIAVPALIYLRQGPKAGWAVNVVDGVPRIGSHSVGSEGKLYVGQWLETDESSRAMLYPGPIGEVKVEPGSRVRVLDAGQNEYRLSLERGEVQAKVSAPPRIFFVDTPSAVAVDLGCAYTLDVDSTGGGSIHVTSGWVELVAKGRNKSQIPADAACLTRPGVGPGTPFFEDASPALKHALAQLDFGSQTADPTSLDTVLAEARKRDSLTLWHLLYRVNAVDRVRVYDRLAELVPPPEGATRAMIMKLDQPMLDEWWLEVQVSWFE